VRVELPKDYVANAARCQVLTKEKQQATEIDTPLANCGYMLGICGAKWWEQKPIGIYADISETIFGIK
jgi:hypothetical protein